MHLPSLDMPHWARFAVNAARQKLALPAAITDGQIYATLQAGGFNVAASERRLADAAQDIALRSRKDPAPMTITILAIWPLAASAASIWFTFEVLDFLDGLGDPADSQA